MNQNSQIYYPKKKVYIVVEGEVEIDYFNRINELRIFPNLLLKCKKGDESKFPTIYQEYTDNEVFLLLDLDVLTTQDNRYQRIENILKNNEYKGRIYISRYSFETWLLNHKILFGKLINNKYHYDAHIKKHFSINHWSTTKDENNRKKMNDSISVDDVNRAIQNCEFLYNKSLEKNDLLKNPVSTIFNFMILLKKLNDE